MPKPSLAVARQLMRQTLPFLGTTAVSQVSSSFDVVLLGLWLGSASAGLYGAAYRVVWMPTMLVIISNQALRPALARGYIDGFSTIRELVNSTTRCLAAFSVGTVIGGIVLAEALLLFLFGEEYRSATRPLQILLAAFGLIAVSRNYRIVLTAFNHERVSFWILLFAALVNIALNLLLIPSHGLAGAATATFVSENCVLVLFYGFVHFYVQHVPLGRYLIRLGLSGAVMALALLVTPE